MRSRLLTALAVALFVAGASAQTSRSSSIPRLPDGHPDLQGVYDLAMLTPVERPVGVTSPVYTDTEAQKLERQVAARKEYSARAIKGDRDAPPKGGDGSAGTTASGLTPGRRSPSWTARSGHRSSSIRRTGASRRSRRKPVSARRRSEIRPPRPIRPLRRTIQGSKKRPARTTIRNAGRSVSAA